MALVENWYMQKGDLELAVVRVLEDGWRLLQYYFTVYDMSCTFLLVDHMSIQRGLPTFLEKPIDLLGFVGYGWSADDGCTVDRAFRLKWSLYKG